MDVSSASSHMLYRRLLDVVLLCGSAGVGYIISKKCPLSHDVMTLKTRVFWETFFSILWPPHSVLRKIIFAGLTTTIRRWRCSPERAVESYRSDRNTVSGSEPTLSRTSCSPSTMWFLFIHWHNSWTKLPPNWLRVKTELNLHIKTTDADSNPGFSNRGLVNVSLLEVTDEAVQTSLIWHICHHADSSLCWHRQLVNYWCCCFTTSDRKQFVHRDERSRGGGDEGDGFDSSRQRNPKFTQSNGHLSLKLLMIWESERLPDTKSSCCHDLKTEL